MNTNIEDGASTPESDLERVKRTWEGQSTDWFLQNLVAMANEREDFDLRITLTVGGSTISGQLINGKRYFSLFAETFVSGWEDGEIKNSWLAGIKEIGDRVYGDADKGHAPQFLHLADARVHHPAGNMPSNMGVLWRGKINAISGFWLGQLLSSEDQQASPTT